MTPQIACIQDLNDLSIFPVIGHIRLGAPKTAGPGPDLDYFRFDCKLDVYTQKFHAIYGPQPKALNIVLVSEDLDRVFANAYKWWGTTLKCHGDGRIAERRWLDVEPEIRKQLGGTHDDYDKVRIPCPCHRQGNVCTMKARFLFMLPDIHSGAVFAINTSSIRNLTQIRGVLRSYKDLLGRISMLPFTLRREPTRLQYRDKSRIHHLLRLSYDGDLTSIQKIRASCGLDPLPLSLLSIGQPSDHPDNGMSAPQPFPGTAPTTRLPQAATLHTAPTNGGPSPAPAPAPDSQHPNTASTTQATDAPPSPAAPLAPRATTPAATPATGQAPTASTTNPRCACGTPVTLRVAEYSTRCFDETLCLPCQRKRTAAARAAQSESSSNMTTAPESPRPS
jgi:hypothetical protein